MNQLEITQQYVTYQSQTQLVNLAQQVATSRSKTKPAIKDAIQVGTQIRLGLEALNYSRFLTKPQIDEILYLLSDIASINGFPFAPTVNSAQLPTILLGVTGPPGPIGPQGVTGGGFPFLVSGVTTDQVIDSFPITLCGAASWTYDVHDAGNKRVETITGCWLPDGSQVRDDGGVTLDPEIGTTVGKISFFVNYAGGNIQLIAHVTSGTWTIAGSRIQIPVNGNGVILPSSLSNGSIWIGSPANTPAEWPVSGDISMSNSGVTNINPGVIVNADIAASAAISLTKLAALSPSLAVVTDGSGFLTTSLTTAAQIGYLSNVTSDIQAQINNKLTVSLGAAATGDILYYNGVNWTNFAKGSPGQLLSSTAGTIAWVSGGSGITNTALNNEMMKSNGVNAVGSSIYSSSLGDLILGAPAQSGGARNLSLQGSAASINLFVQTKGNGGISFFDDLFTLYFGASKSNYNATYTGISEMLLTSALTNTVGDSFKISINTSGTPVAGLGVGMEFQTQTGVATNKVGSIIQSVSTNVGGGTEAFDLVFKLMTAGAAASEKFRFVSTGDFSVSGSVGTSGQFLRSSGAGLPPTWSTVPFSTFINTAANNELIMSNGTNGVPSGLFGDAFGDLFFGSATSGGNVRSLIPQGSGANIGLQFNCKGIQPMSAIADEFDLLSISPGFTIRWFVTNGANPGFLVTKGVTSGTQPFTITAATGISGNINGQDLTLLAGQAFTNGNGGTLNISSGFGNGTGVNGNVIITTNVGGSGGGGFVVLQPTGRFVGIGTVTPVAKLDIITSSEDFFSSGIRIQRSGVATQFGSINYSGGSLNLIATNSTGGGAFTFFSRSNNGTSVLTSMVINDVGSVGIGTSAPAAGFLLDVSGNINFGTNSNTNAQIQYNSTSGVWVAGTNAGGNGTSNNQFFIFDNAASAYRLTIQRGTGNVGIGTTTPARSLHVFGEVFIRETAGQPGGLNITNRNATRLFNVAVDAVSVDDGIFTIIDTTAGLNRLNILPNGNVGIGTTAPNARLHLFVNSAVLPVKIETTSAISPTIDFWDGAVTQNKWQIGVGLSSPTDGAFFIYDGRLSLTRFTISSTGVYRFWSAGGSGTTTATLDANGQLGRSTALAFDVSNNVLFNNNLILTDGVEIFTGLVTGTQLGGSGLQKLSFWGKTPIVQPTTAIVGATRVAGGGGAPQINDTYDGYTIGKVVAALRTSGILA